MASHLKLILAVGATAVLLSGCAALYDPDGFYDAAMSDGDTSTADLALAALAKGNYSRAETLVDQAIKRNPKDHYALLAGGILYQNTNRPQKAKQFYEELITLKPDAAATVGQWQKLAPRSITEIARTNMGLLEAGKEGLLPGAMPLAPKGAGAPASQLPVGMAEGENNAAARFALLRKLAEDGLVTPDEFRVRRAANIGALLPYSVNKPSAAGLERPVPQAEQLVKRLQALSTGLENRSISPAEHAAERGIIIEGILPANPKSTAPPALPPKGLMEAAAMVGRIEKMKNMGVITIEEGERERSAIETMMQAMAKPEESLLPVAEAPTTRSGSSKGASAGSSKSSSKPAKGGSGKPGLHLGSFKTQAQAEKDWASLKSKHSDVLGKLQPSYSKVDVKGKGTFIRLKAGPMASAKAAQEACAKLKAKKQFCDASTL